MLQQADRVNKTDWDHDRATQARWKSKCWSETTPAVRVRSSGRRRRRMAVVHQKVPRSRANNLNNLQRPIRRMLDRRIGEDLQIFPRSHYPPNPPQSNQVEGALRGHAPGLSRRSVPAL